MSLVDFAVGLAVAFVLMLWYGTPFGWPLLGLLPLLLLCLALTLGLGLWTAALNVKYRDFGHLVPFVLQACLYASPVGYGSAVVPARWLTLYRLNPLVGLLEGARWCLLGQAIPTLGQDLAYSTLAAALLMATGLAYFRATERSFADVI